MASTIDIFNSKFVKDDLVGKDKFFNTTQEVTEHTKLQQKYISNVDYSVPANFARFGSAEEYYKNAINYIDSNFVYDASTANKLSWINNLNELEYHIFKNEFPRSTGHAKISGSQYIKIYSHAQDLQDEAKDLYNSTAKYTSRTFLNLDDGITFEAWLNFGDSSQTSSLFAVQALSASLTGAVQIDLFNIFRTSGSSPQISITDFTNTYNFQKTISNNEWHHYAFYVSNDSISLYVDGNLNETINGVDIQSGYDTFVFAPLGLFLSTTSPNTLSIEKQPVFKVGGGGLVAFDELRAWNGKRSIEKIGRYWFTHVDGNDFSDQDNSNLLFYYKFNEGWDEDYKILCLDSSGYQNDGEIVNYTTNCRSIDSGINLSGIVQDTEEADIIYKGLSYSAAVKEYYSSSVQIGIEHDEKNMHLLYNKFPSWILQQEEENETKHLKQIIQIVSSYFDDLYNKISEITEYKNIKLNTSLENTYPFYDKILTSNGFNVTDLFNNLDIVEKISSRSDTNIFDENVQKVKNAIFQNIYNNLSYILKAKGTEKSIKSLLAAYGISENLIKINLYADGADYKAADRMKESIVKKKTVTLIGDNSIYLVSDSIPETTSSHYFTLETSVAFSNYNQSLTTSSIFGLQNNLTSSELSWASNQAHYYVTIENSDYGTRFVLSDASSSASSSYIKDFYDNTVWNLCLRKIPTVDDITSSVGSINYNIELYGVNKNRHFEQEFSCSIPYPQQDGYLRYYIGARKNDLTGSTIYEANSKFLYCNFWTDYLNNEVIISHNRDILNYGVDE